MKEEETDTNYIFRKPRSSDACGIYNLVRESKILYVNSEYLYALIGLHHAKTSSIIENNGKIIGFTSSYLTGTKFDILFIWQIAIDQNYRKKGLALRMLQEILSRKYSKKIKYLHLTISPSNTSSFKLFEALAKSLNYKIRKKRLFDKHLFSQGHEEEELYVIGPIK